MKEGFRRLRERLEAMGFRPSRGLGQNFLVDANLCRAIAETLPLAGRLVLEIGAGTGALTRELAARARRVVAVELDQRLATLLAEDLAAEPWGGRVHLVRGSALDGPRLAPEPCRVLAAEGGPWTLVANLPYRVSGPLLAALCLAEVPPVEALVLVQLELAERVLGRPGSKDYGSLSILCGGAYRPRLLRRVGKEVFRPRPKVDSALLHLAPREGGLLTWSRPRREALARFVQQVFAERRKQGRGALRRLGLADPDARWAELGLDPALLAARPEAWPIEVFFQLEPVFDVVSGHGRS